MIKVSNLVKKYGAKYALSDISFNVGDGEIVGFLGPNGAGKSTTLNIMTGFLSATSGTVEIDGHDILDDAMSAKKLIGYLPELPPLYPDMTVSEYLNFVYELKDCKLNRKKHIEELLEVAKIGDVKNRLIKNLSKGYKQRVGIAQAVCGNPKTVILDEPTIGLDPKQIIEVRNLIRALGRDHSVILSTHILSEVQAVCDRVVIINRGRIAADERTDDIASLTQGRKRFRAMICGPSSAVLPLIRSCEGVTKAEMIAGHDLDSTTYNIECEANADIRKDLFYILAEKDYPLIGMETVGANLEDVFVSLMDGRRKADTKKSRTIHKKVRSGNDGSDI
ncbi:MAG: ATP-binding cassette domain-containing protein [Clostridia bacterium]|nr:ATP-binding cassette domain-containing protein [Clostridia bacterium]